MKQRLVELDFGCGTPRRSQSWTSVAARSAPTTLASPGEGCVGNAREQSQPGGPLGRRLEGQPVTRYQLMRHPREGPVPGLWRFRHFPRFGGREQPAGGVGKTIPQSGELELGADLTGGSRIGDAGPGTDRGEVVADDVGDDVDPDPGRGERAGELAAAPAGEALPDPVHGGDVEAGAEQVAVDRGEVAGSEPRLRGADEAGGAAGQEHPDLVALAETLRRTRDRFRRGQGAGPGLGMIAHHELEPGMRAGHRQRGRLPRRQRARGARRPGFRPPRAPWEGPPCPGPAPGAAGAVGRPPRAGGEAPGRGLRQPWRPGRARRGGGRYRPGSAGWGRGDSRLVKKSTK